MLRSARIHRVVLLLLCTLRFASAQAPGSERAADGQWVMPAHDYAATRFSALREITPANAKQLRAAWSFSTGVLGGHEGQPLVVGHTMYVVTPYPNVLYAFDLTHEGYPLRWKYRPWVNPVAIGIACCDVVNRGAVFAAGKIIYNLLDGFTVAIDTASGREVWKTQIADVNLGETTPMAPLVVKDRVLVGTSGGEYGVRGWLKALDLETGRIVWTGYNVGPDSEVLASPARFRTAYDSGANLGVRTWSGESWRHGGAPVWGWLSYDPLLDLVYYGTGNAAPWNTDQRAGDNKWAASVLARSPGDGSLRWAYQFTPGDAWDFDATQEMILADLPIGGRTRQTLVHFDKNGFAYTLDRGTGELLVAAPYVPTTWATGVDLATGRPRVNPGKVTGASKGNVTDICPTLEGGKNQQPAAFSPITGLFYVPTSNMCMDFAANAVTYIAGTPFMGATTPYRAGPGGNLGAFIAWDAARGKRIWEIKEPYPVWGGALVTGGGVVFYGTLDGWFKAADARTGAVLWKFKAGSGIVGNPVTFRGSDGKQYVAIYAGIGGDWFLLSGDVRSDDPADVRPPASFMPDIARYTSQGGIVWLFSL
ncbi:MAG TPA: PQQ-dependent dehydrogenase, methanol/ethanol family [Gemmatimonadales bacterium]|nr:PQQ-dependent dehydrogenase, methanol/ethanol family [Gemmatimonadales bacterium]